MTMQKKCEALNLQVAEKVRQLRKTASDPNVPEPDRQRARKKLTKYRNLLIAQTAEALNGGSKTILGEA